MCDLAEGSYPSRKGHFAHIANDHMDQRSSLLAYCDLSQYVCNYHTATLFGSVRNKLEIFSPIRIRRRWNPLPTSVL